jgi:hypothetical protein
LPRGIGIPPPLYRTGQQRWHRKSIGTLSDGRQGCGRATDVAQGELVPQFAPDEAGLSIHGGGEAMGRFKPKKQRREQQQAPRQRFHIDDRAVGQAEILAAGAQLSDNVDDNGRLLYMNSPSLGLGQVATGIDTDTGTVQTSDSEDPMPVALFEPERAMLAKSPGEEPTELQVEGAIAAGMRRFPRGIADLRTIPGWALHRLDDDRIELRSPDGGVYSRITVPASPGWYSAALHHGYVVCFYGPQLGVRTPPGSTSEQYTDAKRLDEFRTARGRGLVAGGIIVYRNNR